MTNAKDQSSPVWIIGDSHVSAFAVESGMIPEFPFVSTSVFQDVHACRLGPQLAGTLSLPSSSTGGRHKTFELMKLIPDSARVFFLFGEIDCRAHIVRRACYKDELLEASVGDTIKNYFSFIADVRGAMTERNLRFGVIAPPPTSAGLHGSYRYAGREFLQAISRKTSGRQALRIGRNFLTRKSALRQAIGLALNYAGTESQRREVERMFTARLSENCTALKLDFIDMYHPFISDEGHVRAEWYWDEIHLKQAAVSMIAPQFEEIGIPNFSASPLLDLQRGITA
jgi:hypothetical protein